VAVRRFMIGWFSLRPIPDRMRATVHIVDARRTGFKYTGQKKSLR